MNKKDLIARVRLHMGPGATRRTAEAAVNAVLDSLLRAAEQESVHLTRFGSFEYSLYRERSAYDLNAERLGTIPATRRLKFTPSPNLRRKLNARLAARDKRPSP